MDMKDAFYIDRMLQREKEAGEKVKDELANPSSPQLNWKPVTAMHPG
jgi:hypothetical protein